MSVNAVVGAPLEGVGRLGVVHCGDVLEVLRGMESDSVDCCVTSPPYWGLRDYGHEGQIGLERTSQEFVAKMVEVFQEVRRVLKPSGTCWLNLGDTYASAWSCGRRSEVGAGSCDPRRRANRVIGQGDGSLKEKDLCMIPARVAIALQDDGWYLRQDIIWSKPNPMPESVTDRCTKSHEYVFLLTKSAKYWYDADAIKEPSCKGDAGSSFTTGKTGEHQQGRASGRKQTAKAEERFAAAGLTDHHRKAIRAVGVTDAGKAKVTQDGTGKNTPEMIRLASEAKDALGGYLREFLIGDSRNRRSVWSIATQPYKEAHFATFPEELPRLCILAGCPNGGTVLDLFSGSGTTSAVALNLGRKYIAVELNPEYIPLIEKRLSCVTPPLDLFTEVSHV